MATLRLERPIVFFDLETTGLDFKYDRIIEIGAVKLFPDGHREDLHLLINPGMKIPKEVAALTGIDNEKIKNAPSLAQVAPQVEAYFENADLGGYNVARFDAKVMNEEYKRLGKDFELDRRAIVDAQVIYHKKERRDLTAAYKYFCDKELVGAHSASADTEATYEILLAQLERYDDLPQDVGGLHEFCRGDRDRFVDSEGKFFWRDGEAVFNFGKYKSQSLERVAKHHAEYLDWIISPDRNFSQEVVDICYKAIKGEFPVKGRGEAVPRSDTKSQ